MKMFNNTIRRGCGANLNLFRYAAMLLCVLLLGVGDMWASSHSTHYGKAVLNNATGNGTVYLSTASGSNSGQSGSSNPGTKDGTSWITWKCGGSSGDSKTYYARGTANDGYYWAGWANDKGATSYTASSTGKSFSASSTSSGSPTTTTIYGFFKPVTVTAAPSNVNINATDPSATYNDAAGTVVSFTTANSNKIGDFTTAESGDARWVISAWTRASATSATFNYKFVGNGSYGTNNRTFTKTVTLTSKGDASSTRTCTLTAKYPNPKVVACDEDATDLTIYPTFKATDAKQAAVEKTAVFDVVYADNANNFSAAFSGATGSGTWTVTGISVDQANQKATVTYTFNGNKSVGTHTAVLTLTAANCQGWDDTSAAGGVSATVTLTAENTQEATNDASVTTTANVTTEYATFAQALAAANATSGATLTLLRNVDLGTITATNNINKAMTIDLNGKELRAAVNATSVGILNLNANVAVTIKDSKTGGKIINEIARNAEIRTITVTKGTLTLESGTITVHNTGQYASAANADLGVSKYASCQCRTIHQAAGTTVNVTGGRVEAYGTRSVYGILQASSAATNNAGTTILNVSGGEIYAEGPYSIMGIYAYGKVNFSGGTINVHVNTNMIDARYAADNANNFYNGYGYGIYANVSSSATASSCYYATVEMTGGTINVTNDRSYNVDRRNYGILFNAASTVVASGKTGADGTLTQKASATGSIDGGEINVTSGTQYSFGVYVLGDYNSYDNTHHTVQIKNCKITSKAYVCAYGVAAWSGFNGTNNGCYAGDVELTNCDVYAESLNTSTAAAVWVTATGGTLFKDDSDATKSRCYGEYAVAGKAVINSGKYEAKTKTTTAMAVGTSTRAKTVYDPITTVQANRIPGGNAEAYPILIIHGGTFKATSTTTTARGVSNGGYCTIDGGTFEAYATTTTAQGLYCLTGKITASGVTISASATGTAYGALADVGIPAGNTAQTGFAYAGEIELNNCDITATTRTSTEARGVVVNATNKVHNWTQFKADSTSNKWATTTYNAYKSVFPCTIEGRDSVGIAIAAKATINGCDIKATAATTTAYGVYAICSFDAKLDSIATPRLNIKNTKMLVKTDGTTTANGIYTQGETVVDGCDITVQPKTTTGYGIQALAPNNEKVTVSNTKITVTTTNTDNTKSAAAYGIYGQVDINATHGLDRHGNLVLNEGNEVNVSTTSGTTAYAVFLNATKRAITTTGGAYRPGDYANAATAIINGGKYTAYAAGTTGYALGVTDPQQQGEVLATPTLIVNGGKFKGTAASTPYADVHTNGETGYFVLNGGYYVKDENLDKKLGEGMNKVAVKSGTPEYTEGYRWRITDNMTGEIVCKVYEGTTLKQSYQSLEEALAYVNLPDNSSKTQTIVMCGNYTLSSGDYELPANKTLLVPYKSGQTSAVGTSPSWVNVNNYTYSTPTPYCKLTFAEGVNMTVKGKIEASAQTYVSNTGLTTIGTAVVANTYGWIYLNEGSYVDLESGSSLQAWGYITGKGEINAKNGSYIYEDFQLGDWRGGTMASSIRGNTNGLNSKGVFLVTHYYYQNIEAPVIYRPGATAQAYSGCYMKYVGNAVTDEPVTMVGTSNAMFLMDPATAGDNTWVRKEYDPSTDYMNWTMNSGASLGSITLSVYVEVNSKDYVLPITSNFNIVANYGDITITNDVCFIPGSKLTIKKEGSVTIPSNTRVFFYDYDDWSSYSGKFFKPYYSPSWKFNPRTTIGDAMVKIEGTLNLQGVGYTTAHGANICSTRENAGKIIFGSAAPASTEAIAAFTGNSGKNKTLCQLVGNGSEGQYAGKALNSIWLKNEDGSYSKTGQDEGGANTPANKTWIYMEDDDHVYRWILSYEDGCFTYKNNGSGDKQLIHPSDWVAVESNANGDHAYHSEDGTRMFINAKATTANKSCVWWEVDPTPEVISGTTYYVANNDYFDNYGTYFYWDNSVSYWKPKKVTVIWKDKDGNKIANGSYGDLYSFNTSPQFFGANPVWANTSTEKHDWIGWRDAEGNIYDKNATLPVATGDVTYTAYFQTSKYQYTITFKNEDDNKVIWAGLMDAGDPAVCPVEPTQESTVSTVYTFSNWVGYAVNATLPTITGPATYTAHYTTSTRQYHVTFYNYDAATVLFETDVDYNTRPVYGGVTPFRANTSAFSYEWTGWQQGANTYDTDDDLAFVTGDVYYVATFSQTDLKYQVLFKRQDGSIIDAPFFNFEETPAAFPANPTLASTVSTDYTFDHWDPATLQPVTVDGMVYTAHFSESPRQYTAHFVNYDGTSLGVDQTIDYNTVPAYTGATPFKPNDSRNSFEFAGWAWEAGADWDAGSIGVGEAFPAIKGEITFKAQFTETLLQFNVLYVREDGTIILQDKKKWGESTAFPSVSNYEDATHTYTFDHWSPATVVTPVTTDATYTAYFNQGVKTYSISNFSISPAGYGTVSPASVTGIPSGSSVTVNGNMITVNGQTITATPTAADAQYTYTFDHWNNVPATVTANVTNIEAVFTRTTRTYTVTWKNGDATLETDENVAYGATPHYDGATPTKAADAEYTYTFNGWSPDVSSVTGNATYTATYTSTANVASVAASGTPTTYHATVADAISAANGKTNAVVTMLQNASVTSKITISAAMTIDLNGKTITSTIATKETGTFYINASDKTVTIRDNGTGGKIYQEVSCSGGYLYGIHVYAGTLTIESGTIYTKNTANKRANGIYTSDNATAINILTGGKIETVSAGQAFGIYAYNSCALTINGGTVTANGSANVRGIYIKGTTTLTNATIESTASGSDSRAIFTNSGVNLTINSGTYTATGTDGCYAIYERSGTTLTINGGRFSGREKEILKDGGSLTITGGVYKHDTDIQGYCATNYHVFDLTSGADYDAGYRYEVAEAYKVTWNATENGGSCETAYTLVKKGTAIGAVPEASKTGHDFLGWFTTISGGGNQVTAATIINFATTAYARFAPSTYDITYKDQGDSDFSGVHGDDYPTTHTYGTVTALVSPTKYGYTFEGWYDNAACTGSALTEIGATAYTADLTLYAKWAIKTNCTITWLNYNDTPLHQSTTSWGGTPYYPAHLGTPTREGDEHRTYTFKGWSPEIHPADGDETYIAQYNMSITTGENGSYTVSGAEDAVATTVQVSGSLHVPEYNSLTTTDLILEASDNCSGMIEGLERLQVNGNAYFDYDFNTDPWHWSAFGVPFEIDIDAAPLLKEKTTPLVLGSDYDIVYYDSEERALHGPSTNCWKYVEYNSHTLVPGRLYMIAFNRPLGHVNVIRFTKASGAAVDFTSNVPLYNAGSGINDNWNGIANPKLFHALLNAGVTECQVHDGGEIKKDGYDMYDMNNKKFFVGKAVFVQVPYNQSPMYADPATTQGPIVVKAPRRTRAEESAERYDVKIAPMAEEMEDHIYLLTSEDKADEYVIVADLVKAGVSPVRAQMWVERYGVQLCKNTTEWINNVADYPLGISVPADGDYDIWLEDRPDNDDLMYLTLDGERIWNLSYGACTIELKKGTTQRYGIRVISNAPSVTTGMDAAGVLNEESIRKVLIDEKVYIIRNGELYSITGQKAK